MVAVRQHAGEQHGDDGHEDQQGRFGQVRGVRRALPGGTMLVARG